MKRRIRELIEESRSPALRAIRQKERNAIKENDRKRKERMIQLKMVIQHREAHDRSHDLASRDSRDVENEIPWTPLNTKEKRAEFRKNLLRSR